MCVQLQRIFILKNSYIKAINNVNVYTNVHYMSYTTQSLQYYIYRLIFC